VSTFIQAGILFSTTNKKHEKMNIILEKRQQIDWLARLFVSSGSQASGLRKGIVQSLELEGERPVVLQPRSDVRPELGG
jgi:hypothetical protein